MKRKPVPPARPPAELLPRTNKPARARRSRRDKKSERETLIERLMAFGSW